MFWEMCCCRSRPTSTEHELKTTPSKSQNSPINAISTNLTEKHKETDLVVDQSPSTRQRTESNSSMFSMRSYYSVRSSVSGKDVDFYSLCSEDSYKST